MSKTKKDYAFFALVSDIHGNIDALDAVLADMKQFPIQAILCLGDVIGYGPESAACLDKVMDLCALTVMGNHEAMLLMGDRLPSEALGDKVGRPIQLALEQTSESHRQWIGNLPLTADLAPVSLCHASLNEPAAFHYIHGVEEAEANFSAQTTNVSFHGHTHVPVVWKEAGEIFTYRDISEQPIRLRPDQRYTVNVGSVGQPRDRDSRAGYVLYDYQARVLLHRRVAYDIARAQKRFRKAKLPAFNASRLKVGR